MMNCIQALVAVAIGVAFFTLTATAQHNPHARLMERAHPTPDPEMLRDVSQPKLPFVQGTTTFPSLFENINMISEENDPLPVQNESSIAVNPLNPMNLIGSAVDYRNNSSTKAYYSKDGGRTWNNVDLGRARPDWRSSNDPSVAFDHNGIGYLCYGGFNRVGNQQFGENAVFISRTTDGGETWVNKHTAVIIHTGQQTVDSAFEDKYYVHADTAATSPFRGRLYIPWKRVINADSSTQIVIARSTDGGLTWLPPVHVSDRFPGTSEDATFGQSFPLARTGPDGGIHLVWNSGTESSVRYARSTDGGETWTAPRILHTYQPFGKKSEVAGQVNSRVKEVVRAEAYPTLTIDNTGGPNNGNIYLCWSADEVPNVYTSRSLDNGETWSNPMTVTSDDSNDQFWPWIALDPTTGNIAVMYFDSRDDEENILVNVYVSLSTDAGLTWVDRRAGDDINDLRRNPFSGNTFAGDYSGCDFYNGIVYPSWVDMRHTTDIDRSDNDVYTALVNTMAPSAPETMTATTLPELQTSIDVSWSAVATRSFGQPLAIADAVFLLSRDGNQIAELPLDQLSYRDTGLIAYEEYRYTLVAATIADTSADRWATAFSGGSRAPAPPVLNGVRGDGQGRLLVNLTLPTQRLDSATPLANLAKTEVLYGNPAIALASTLFDAERSDTGKTIDETVDPLPNGWFWVTSRVVDSDGNTSPTSDTIWVYTGDMTWDLEDFTDPALFWERSGEWARTTSFAYSEPASYTESPDGEYGRSRRDTSLLYPRVLTASPLRMSWRVAAFIDESDLVTLERSSSSNGPWTELAWWNETLDPRWVAQLPGDDAWRWGSATIDGTVGDTVYFQLTMRSNIVNHGDGFYIDDITFDDMTSVQEESELMLSIAPQPATSHFNIGLKTESMVNQVQLVGLTGDRMPITFSQYSSTLVVDVQMAASGTYILEIIQGQRRSTHQVQILR